MDDIMGRFACGAANLQTKSDYQSFPSHGVRVNKRPPMEMPAISEERKGEEGFGELQEAPRVASGSPSARVRLVPRTSVN